MQAAVGCNFQGGQGARAHTPERGQKLGGQLHLSRLDFELDVDPHPCYLWEMSRRLRPNSYRAGCSVHFHTPSFSSPPLHG